MPDADRAAEVVDAVTRAEGATNSTDKDDAVYGWSMYDWANSTYSTSVVVAILPAYFVYLYETSMGTDASLWGFSLTSSNMWAFAITISSIVVAIGAPALGVIADRRPIKMDLLKLFTKVGAGTTILFGLTFLLPISIAWLWVWILFLLSNLGFLAATTVYNSLLPYLGDDDEMDSISSKGFAYGYIGGGLLLFVHLALVMLVPGSWVVPFCLATAGMWWWGFSLITFRLVPEPEVPGDLEPMSFGAATKFAFGEVAKTLKEIRAFPVLTFYLIAYLLFIDGVNTVINMAAVFGADELGVALMFNILVILLIQFTAAPAAMFFAFVARKTSTLKALTATLIGWCVVIIVALGFAPLEPDTHDEFDMRLTWVDANGTYDVTVSDAERVLLGSGAADVEFRDKHGAMLPLDDSKPPTFNSSLTTTATAAQAEALLADIGTSRWSVTVSGGPVMDANSSCPQLDGYMDDQNDTSCRVMGVDHPASLGDGKVDGIAIATRNVLWEPLGMSIGFQWLTLGLLAGLMMGGSQALARSLFGVMVPETRSAEFFGFFGFTQKVASIIGPLLFGLITGFFDARTGILSITVLIVIGTAMLPFVDVKEGARQAAAEDARRRGITESE